MKPKPFSALNHLTVPVAMSNLLRGHAQGFALCEPPRRRDEPRPVKSTGNTKMPDEIDSSKALEVNGNHNCNWIKPSTTHGSGHGTYYFPPGPPHRRTPQNSEPEATNI